MILRSDHVAGGAFIAAGALVLAVSGDLPFGTLASPGAGMLPKLRLGLMIAFGALLFVRAGESPPLADDRLERPAARAARRGRRGCRGRRALHRRSASSSRMSLLLFVLTFVRRAPAAAAAAAFSIGVTVARLPAVRHAAEIAAAARRAGVLSDRGIHHRQPAARLLGRVPARTCCSTPSSAAWSAPWSACCRASGRWPASASCCR